jgi:hypothetical protein
MIPATHVRAPEGEKEKCESDRPPEQEAENGRDDHAGMNAHMRAVGLFGTAPSVDICGVGHFPLHHGITPL